MLHSALVIFLTCFGIFVLVAVIICCLASFIPYGALVWKMFPVILILCALLAGCVTGIALLLRASVFKNFHNGFLLGIIAAGFTLLFIVLVRWGIGWQNNKAKEIRFIVSSHISEQEKIGKLASQMRFLVNKNKINSWAEKNYYDRPLNVAIQNREPEVVKFLLNHGVDANAERNDKTGHTALHEAVRSADPKLVKILLEAKADPNALSYDHTALSMAAGLNTDEQTRREIVKLLIDAGADVNRVNSKGETPLQQTLGVDDAAKLIYESGGRLGEITPEQIASHKGWMYGACRCGCSEIVDQLLKAGVQPTARHAIGAAQEGQTKILKQLVAAGLDINQPDDKGNYPFLYAISNGNLDTVRFFVERGADLTWEQTSEGGGTIGPALVLASLEGHLPVVKYLVEQKADVNIQNRHGDTPLVVAISRNHQEVALFLLAQPKINVNKQNKHGSSALTWAAEKGNIVLIEALLKAGANPNLADVDNDTALGNAAFNGNIEAVRMLIKAKADINSKNKDGKTALMLAREQGHAEVVELLKSAGAKE